MRNVEIGTSEPMAERSWGGQFTLLNGAHVLGNRCQYAYLECHHPLRTPRPLHGNSQRPHLAAASGRQVRNQTGGLELLNDLRPVPAAAGHLLGIQHLRPAGYATTCSHNSRLPRLNRESPETAAPGISSPRARPRAGSIRFKNASGRRSAHYSGRLRRWFPRKASRFNTAATSPRRKASQEAAARRADCE